VVIFQIALYTAGKQQTVFEQNHILNSSKEFFHDHFFNENFKI
jgi:hypothetical protein